MTTEIPVIDVGSRRDEVARALDEACRTSGFFYVVGHGVDERLQRRLETLAREFFGLDEQEKSAIAMVHGGRAWRGWFPLGGELTSGVADQKEGLYFGTELGADHPRVRAGVPLHGANLFPERPAGLRDAVLAYLDAMTRLGHTLAEGLAQALGLDAGWFAEHLTADPTILFRIFHYPPTAQRSDEGWGVAEHTDYGLLTMVRQDDVGGLEVRTPGGWMAAPPIPGSFVCNLGDMLERMTGGAYRSTPHRVRNTSTTNRVSFAFFFDPSWEAEILPVPVQPTLIQRPDEEPRWDGASVHDFSGTYGDYLLGKVAKVFPQLGDQHLD
ncbi:MAG TPA: 2-oxoglutarate and iron-dependent oxygenase domain-containing protein [Acidimicrobiales bacterium]